MTRGQPPLDSIAATASILARRLLREPGGSRRVAEIAKELASDDWSSIELDEGQRMILALHPQEAAVAALDALCRATDRLYHPRRPGWTHPCAGGCGLEISSRKHTCTEPDCVRVGRYVRRRQPPCRANCGRGAAPRRGVNAGWRVTCGQPECDRTARAAARRARGMIDLSTQTTTTIDTEKESE